MVEEVVLAHGAHVGDQALARLHAELLQGDPLPLGRRLHDLGVDRVLAVVVVDVEADRSARAVAVEVVVDAALGVDDERHLDTDEVELAAEAVLDEALDGGDRLLGLLGVEQRQVVVREDLFEVLVVADAGTGEVGLLVERWGRGECRRHGIPPESQPPLTAPRPARTSGLRVGDDRPAGRARVATPRSGGAGVARIAQDDQRVGDREPADRPPDRLERGGSAPSR